MTDKKLDMSVHREAKYKEKGIAVRKLRMDSPTWIDLRLNLWSQRIFTLVQSRPECKIKKGNCRKLETPVVVGYLLNLSETK